MVARRYACQEWTRLAMVLAAAMVALGCLAPAAAAAAISQGYQSSQPLAPGTVVATKGSSQNQVVPADTTTANDLLGAVVSSGSATLAVTTAQNQQQVITSGTTQVFVSDVNGPIASGDAITASPIQGVGMKATASGKIVGIAQQDFSTAGSTTTTVHLKNGQTQTVHVGSLPVLIQVGYYTPPAQNTPIPRFLQVFANALAGKDVSVARVVASALIVLMAMMASGVLLFAGVRSTMVSIGRNPLAQSSIYRGLWQVVGAAVMIMAAALSGAYVVISR